MKNQKLKIILATGLAVFNLFMCFTGVVAWFTAAKVNDASDMQIQMYTHELDVSYRVFRYDDDEKAGLDVTNNVDALKLPDYDSVITSRNEHTPIIIEFTISGMSLNEETPIYLNTHCTNSTLDAYVLSNIIELKLDYGMATIDESSASTIYDSAVSHFKENVTDRKFKNETKLTDILYTVEDYTELIDDGKLKIYMQIDYSVDLIRALNLSFSAITAVNFPNDLTLINCYTER